MTPDTANPASAAAQTGSGNALCFDSEEFQNSPAAHKTQVNFQVPAEGEFDAEIARALTASGWRAAAALLINAALLIEAGDYLNAERNRQRAREQFIEANDVFRQFREDRAAAASVIGAEAFL